MEVRMSEFNRPMIPWDILFSIAWRALRAVLIVAACVAWVFATYIIVLGPLLRLFGIH